MIMQLLPVAKNIHMIVSLWLFGSKANDTSMYADLDIPTYIVGDCKKAGVALDAFKDAYHAVLEINK